ncbi:pirin family protein [Marinimicrobium agarilyticum]|uniref:pirin family protein n=1 Tax=Marinimicrobium agarilyticum TaxID=306546 RepID=UPI000684D430|nr:pirin family protein [Marinimicrobium agarilyticum]
MQPNSNVVQLDGITTSGPVRGGEFTKGRGFSARQFRREDFDGLMDPLIMVDDYAMTEPTFGAHPHAGIAAISVLFEDSKGLFYNHDSLDNHLALRAGDLYWLNAGKGAMHDESPLPHEARIRGLQMFLKLPANASEAAPTAHHVRADDIPVLQYDGVRVRVIAGETHGLSGFCNDVVPATVLDGQIATGATFEYSARGSHAVWIYVVSGEAHLGIDGHSQVIQSGESIAIHNHQSDQRLDITGTRDSHVVIVESPISSETYVNHGPFALKDCSAIANAQAAAQAGEMGQVIKKAVTNLSI